MLTKKEEIINKSRRLRSQLQIQYSIPTLPFSQQTNPVAVLRSLNQSIQNKLEQLKQDFIVYSPTNKHVSSCNIFYTNTLAIYLIGSVDHLLLYSPLVAIKTFHGNHSTKQINIRLVRRTHFLLIRTSTNRFIIQFTMLCNLQSNFVCRMQKNLFH